MYAVLDIAFGREHKIEESSSGASSALVAVVSEIQNIDREALSINPNTSGTYAARQKLIPSSCNTRNLTISFPLLSPIPLTQ
jgi:hypothetical protein